MLHCIARARRRRGYALLLSTELFSPTLESSTDQLQHMDEADTDVIRAIVSEDARTLTIDIRKCMHAPTGFRLSYACGDLSHCPQSVVKDGAGMRI